MSSLYVTTLYYMYMEGIVPFTEQFFSQHRDRNITLAKKKEKGCNTFTDI